MGLFSGLLGSKPKFNDAQLVARATSAIDVDPMISDPGAVVVNSKHGVVTVSGLVQRAQEKDRVEGVVHNALTTMGLKHERIVNDLKLPEEARIG